MDGISFLFGTVTPAHDENSIRVLRYYLDKTQNKTQNLEWIRDTIRELPDYWDLLIRKIPSIDGSYPGRELLGDFDRWLRQGFQAEEDPVELGNTVLLPLVVIVGLVEFWQYVESKNRKSEDPLQELVNQLREGGTHNVESIGLCAGMLTAYAVAGSHNYHDFKKYGAAAIRLAMMLGVATDAQDAWHGKAKSYGASWRTTDQGEQLKHIIGLVYPQAYTSVAYDERRVTITTTAEWIRSSVLRQLQGAGVTVAESNILGPIHSPNKESRDIADVLCELSRDTPALQLADVSKLAFPTYTNDGHGRPVSNDVSLHELVLQSSLAKTCSWYETFVALPLARPDSTRAVVSFGPERCVPPSMVASVGGRWIHISNLSKTVPPEDNSKSKTARTAMPTPSETPMDTPKTTMATPTKTSLDSIIDVQTGSNGMPLPESTIAVVGMSIKTAGADDIDEFSRMIQSGISQHELAGPERIKFHTMFREGDWDPAYKWYANWMRNIDNFDHQFFKKSPREAANMDPQQRLALQAAYLAVENAGYFTRGSNPKIETNRQAQRDPNHIGVYLGVTLDDYMGNVRTHRANAFSITGTMRSLIAGKIAHHFGWTGPAMTVDTACSSSAVAIHTACRSILTGDCYAALAGGANVITDPLAFQDLSAAGFLSPTGQCKPFDERADGYCRGEAVGFVFLKRLSDALADGNQIYGCIASSATYQNENHTPIFVPNAPSLSNLFTDVIRNANVKPSDISYVECHGTGTSVGDPAEWEGVRTALEADIAEADRTEPVYLGSAKGHLGHTEGASGIVGLIKVLAMINGQYIPPQASHSRLNHLIKPSTTFQVASSLRPWNASRKVALFNNYGASGSNVAMIVSEPPLLHQQDKQIHSRTAAALPFCIAGRTANSVRSACASLLQHLELHPELDLADIAFNMHRHFNRSLPSRLSFTCGSLDELKGRLSGALTLSPSPAADVDIIAVKLDRPVILCFGGQVSKSVGLDRKLFEGTQILRHYLNQCDAALESQGLRSIYPDIFSQQPVQDQQHLQTMLFAMQYACAMCWMQSGLSDRIHAVIGHSFGELSAMCISGALTLNDAVKLIAGRAALIRDKWGSDPGLMLAVEAELETVQRLLSEANNVYTGTHPASIACYNGPTSFTLAGSQDAINNVTRLIAQSFPSVRSKTLKVSNAFHSSLVDPLEKNLEALGQSLAFHKATLRLERTTEQKSSPEDLGPRYALLQMRQPVFFRHAVQRLAEDLPNSVWLEAGSNSTVAVMAQRALDPATRRSHHFQSVNISSSDALAKLGELTASLWKEGVPCEYWPHNGIQTNSYATLVLPSYQFEKDKHWVDLKSPVELVEQIKQTIRSEVSITHPNANGDSNARFTFVGYKDSDTRNKSQPCFHINTACTEVQDLITSHVVAHAAGILSGMIQVNLAIAALSSLHPDWSRQGLRLSLHDMAQYAPVCLDPSRILSLEFDDQGNQTWTFKIYGVAEGASRILHTTGRFQLRDPNDRANQAEFRRLSRLVDHERCLSLLSGFRQEDDEILQGHSIYRTFQPVVNFGMQYQSLRALIGRGNESAGHFMRTPQNDAWFDLVRGEHISQTGGIWVNCMTEHSQDDLFVGSEIEMWMVSPQWANRSLPDKCDVLARHQRHAETGDYTTDSFVFDSKSGDLVEVVLGVRYTRTASAPFIRLLQRLSGQPAISTGSKSTITTNPVDIPVSSSQSSQHLRQLPQSPKSSTTKPQLIETPRRDLLKEMAEVVANLVGVDVADIGLDDDLVDFGIDSLLGMELQGDIRSHFGCAPEDADMMTAKSLRDLVRCLPIAVDLPALDKVNDDAQQSDDSSQEPSDPYWSNRSSDDNGSISSTASDLLWDGSDILEAFAGTKMHADKMIVEHGLDNYDSEIVPDSNRLCIALVVEGFEHLGCSLRTAQAGDVLDPVPFEPQHQIYMNWILQFLEKVARLITVEDSGKLKRTNASISTTSSKDILEELLPKYPKEGDFLRLTYHAGIQLANALQGKTDGNRVLMGTTEGRKLCQSVYHNYPLNLIGFDTVRDVLARLKERIRNKGPLRVLEMGGGTGSLTSVLLPLLAKLDIPVEYTFTDLSASLVAQARRSLGKQYPFMKFAVQDIEKPVPDELAGQQHIVVASHAVHATRSLTISTRSIRHALRPDGFLMVLEMREAWPTLDLTFGLYEGWWLFEDGRTHAYCSPETWQRSLTDAGYGPVDWTDGKLPEHKYYMVVIALASAMQEK